MRQAAIYALLLTGAFLARGAALAGQADPAPGTWEVLYKAPPGEGIQDFGIDGSGGLWVCTVARLLYSDGGPFRPVPLPAQPGRRDALHGGPDRGLFLSMVQENSLKGQLFALSDGEARFVTEFYDERSPERPNVYSSRDGRILNWGSRFLAQYVDGNWERREALLDTEHTRVLDGGTALCAYYDGRLYGLRRDGGFSHAELDAGNLDPRDALAALWQSERLLLAEEGGTEVRCFDRNSGEPVSCRELNERLEGRELRDMRSGPDGEVWFLLADPELNGTLLCRAARDGAFASFPATAGLGCRGLGGPGRPGTVLFAPDGAIWSGHLYDGVQRLGGVRRYHGGTVGFFGWEGAVKTGRVSHVLEGPDGTVHASDERAVYAFHPDESAPPNPPIYPRWREEPIFAQHFYPGIHGGVWAVTLGRTTVATHLVGPFREPVEMGRSGRDFIDALVDDRGQLLIRFRHRPFVFADVSASGVQFYSDVQVLLQHAVRDGATWFHGGSDYSVCSRPDKGTLCYAVSGRKRMHFYDGDAWHTVGTPELVDRLFESRRYEAVARTRQGNWLGFDGAQIIELRIPADRPSRWLLGPQGAQPFEAEIVEARPGLYLPVERTPGGGRFILRAEDGGYVPGDRIPHGVETGWPARPGWVCVSPELSAYYRIQNGRVEEHDFAGTPLEAKERPATRVAVDAEGNLWFTRNGRGDAFLKLAAPAEAPSLVRQ
ncbi:MAG: hypothetical protein R6X33_15410 [Candidatus Brocadiia bacterium]